MTRPTSPFVTEGLTFHSLDEPGPLIEPSEHHLDVAVERHAGSEKQRRAVSLSPRATLDGTSVHRVKHTGPGLELRKRTHIVHVRTVTLNFCS